MCFVHDMWSSLRICLAVQFLESGISFIHASFRQPYKSFTPGLISIRSANTP